MPLRPRAKQDIPLRLSLNIALIAFLVAARRGRFRSADTSRARRLMQSDRLAAARQPNASAARSFDA
jgi:hypothetical protein